MSTNFDVIVVGAGINGLVTANYLAKSGRRVLVLERRERVGGQAAPGAFSEGRAFEPLHPSGHLRADIVRDLDLRAHGLSEDVPGSPPAYVSLLPDGQRLVLRAVGDDAETLASLKALSAKDAARWPEFVAFMDKAAAFLDAAYATPMPRLPKVGIADGMPLGRLLWRLRGLGKQDMFRVIRSLSMSTVEFGEEWFESEPVRAAIAALGIHGVTLGSMSAGTGYTLMHNWLNRGGLAHRPVDGGPGRVAEILAATLKSRGGEVLCSSEVARIVVDKQVATGVVLANGEELGARAVYSAADPRRTLLGLVGAPELPPEFAWQAQSIKMRGSVAKIHLLTDGTHGLPAGTLVVAPTTKYLERAFDAAKYGEVSKAPYLEVTSAGAVVSIHYQFAPFALRGSDWDTQGPALARTALGLLAPHLPKLAASIKETVTLTPADIARDYALTEADLNHGQLILDQMLFMRPMPGWSDHRTPVENLFLCGGGVHGGGGISGAAGRNAARVA
jgi:phytoene dehydrogenase-like protein